MKPPLLSAEGGVADMGRVQATLVLNDKMSKVLGQINRAMSSVIDSFEAVQRASGRSFNTAEIAVARRELGAADAALSEMEKSYRECINKQDRLNNSIGQGTNAANSLMSKIKGIASAYLGMKAVNGLVGLSDTMTQTNARLDMMNDGKQDTAALKDMIYASAQRSRGSYLGTADAVAKLGVMAGDAFKGNNKETIAFVEQLNKHFKIAGTSAQGIDAAMLQLTQAMGAGVLRGEEFNSVMEQAPNIMQTIAGHMGVQIGQLRNMAAEGKITAEVVKDAMLETAGKTDGIFNEIPMTWSDMWTAMKSTATKSLEPMLAKINQLANSESVQQTVNGLMSAFTKLSFALLGVFNQASKIYSFFVENWGVIAPCIFGIVIAVGAYNAALLINNIIQAISTGLKTAAAIAAVAHGTATVAETAATTGMTTAQVAFNAALYACPLTWILAVIIAVIAAIYMVIAIINKVTGKTISATGVIFGCVCWLLSVMWNLFVGQTNAIIQFLWTNFVEPWIGIVEWVLNVFNGGFDSFGDGVKNLLGNIISWFLSLGKVVTQIIDAIFGTNWTGGLNSLQSSILKWGKNEKATTLSRQAPTVQSLTGGKIGRWSSKGAYSKGYAAGEKLEDSAGNLLNFDMGKLGDDAAKAASGTPGDASGGALGDIAKNTGDTAKNTGKSNEELSYLRDIAERDAINRFTTAEIRVDLGGVTNNVAANTDLDGIISYLTDGVEEALLTASEGVY